ncbi:hypothetical protein CALVIDRAFT_540211 [Calocera viscosa TUFC12733]|uniref:Uncharacterized protein n=1 Tax=Calocera viscosa (strain TUFC12733) TaxID=1330018 RepID=A0A167J3M6_CALVF|nr:hypothetical protein CALVIDRAFT_540211 [Calocera viscosa TUFC12733]
MEGRGGRDGWRRCEERFGRGAVDCGFVRVLVKTGKYRQGDERKGVKPPDLVVESFAEFVEMLLE